MTKESFEIYFLAEAMTMPLYAIIAAFQTFAFWWSYPLIFIGRMIYGVMVLQEYGWETYLNILFSLQRYQIFLEFFFYRNTNSAQWPLQALGVMVYSFFFLVLARLWQMHQHSTAPLQRSRIRYLLVLLSAAILPSRNSITPAMCGVPASNL